MEVLRNLFEGYPNLWGGGVAHSRTDSVTNHSVWNHPCKNQSAGSISGSYLDTLCRNRIQYHFQHESGRTPAPLSKKNSD